MPHGWLPVMEGSFWGPRRACQRQLERRRLCDTAAYLSSSLRILVTKAVMGLGERQGGLAWSSGM